MENIYRACIDGYIPDIVPLKSGGGSTQTLKKAFLPYIWAFGVFWAVLSIQSRDLEIAQI